MTRRFGFILGALATFGLMLFVPPALHAQTMGEYGTVTGGQAAAGAGQWNSMSAGVDTSLAGASGSMSRSSQPDGSAHMIEIPGGPAARRAKSEHPPDGNPSDDPSTHDWVRVR